MSTDATDQHVVTTPGVCGDKPHIDRRRITVQAIVIWHEQMGFSVDEIATLHDLSLSEIYSALAYYHDHQAEIHRSIQQDEEYAEAMRVTTPSLVAQRLYERAG